MTQVMRIHTLINWRGYCLCLIDHILGAETHTMVNGFSHSNSPMVHRTRFLFLPRKISFHVKLLSEEFLLISKL